MRSPAVICIRHDKAHTRRTVEPSATKLLSTVQTPECTPHRMGSVDTLSVAMLKTFASAPPGHYFPPSDEALVNRRTLGEGQAAGACPQRASRFDVLAAGCVHWYAR